MAISANSSWGRYLRGLIVLGCILATGPLFGQAAPATNVTVSVIVDYSLKPGQGFTAPTAQPPTVGTVGTVGYDANAIARWDVVPFQTFTDTFRVGVVAFHREGIHRVEFSVNGGPWVPVPSPQLNPQTGVIEYVGKLNATEYADGPIEVRAVAYPNVGIPRVLESLILNVNSQGRMPSTIRYVSTTGSDSNDGLTIGTAFATLSKARDSISAAQSGDMGGGVIRLGAGTYTLGGTNEPYSFFANTRWLTIEPNPGLSQSDVTISKCGAIEGLRTSKVCLRRLRVTTPIQSWGVNDDHLWLSEVAVVGTSLTQDLTPVGWTYEYITDSTISTVQRAINDYNFARNVTCVGVGESGVRNTAVAINCSVAQTVRGSPDYHPDVFQYTYPQPNSILYGFTATNGIDDTFGIRMQPEATDIAIVNANIKMGKNTYYLWELERPYSNIFLHKCILDGFWSKYDTFTATNLVFDNCSFPRATPPPTIGLTIR